MQSAAVERAKSAPFGPPMGAADIATVLFTRFLKFDPADSASPDRDRFVLSAGHGSCCFARSFISSALKR
jgi:transketolase